MSHMRTLAWQQFFAAQREQHGKVVFSVAELANVAQTSLHNVNTELGRLVKRGVIARYAQGRYGLPQGVNAEALIHSLDAGAYVTGFYCLFGNHLVTQAPFEITCFTNRRHNRLANRVSPVGKLRFVCVPSAIYRKPVGLTSAEQALCDFCWLMLRDGVEPRSQVTFRNLHRLKAKKLRFRLKRYPEIGPAEDER